MSHADGESGFSLIEVLVALTVLALVLVGAFGAAAADLRASRAATVKVEAALLAEELLERIDTWPAEQLNALISGEGGRFEAPMERFRWHVQATSGPDADDLHKIHVTVTWETGDLSLHTLRAWPAIARVPGRIP